MNAKTKIQLIGFLSVLIFSSCVKEIEFKSNEIEPKIVVNSLFTPDSMWRIHVSQSKSISSTSNMTFLSNASVKLFDQSQQLIATLQHAGQGYYTASGVTPGENQAYSIEVSAPGYTSVTATNHTTSSIPLIHVDTATSTDSEGNQQMEVTVQFSDPAGISNYYLLELIGKYKQFNAETGDSVFVEEPLMLHCLDPNVEQTNTLDFQEKTGLFNYLMIHDDFFDGSQYGLKFRLNDWPSLKHFDLQCELRFIHASEAYYLYRKSYAAYLKVVGNPFAQPVQVYSNINNGIGIFAGATPTFWTIQF